MYTLSRICPDQGDQTHTLKWGRLFETGQLRETNQVLIITISATHFWRALRLLPCNLRCCMVKGVLKTLLVDYWRLMFVISS